MTERELMVTKDLAGKPVFDEKDSGKRIGKVSRFVFHPSEKRCIGFMVKRPDLLWMFPRKDLFVPLGAFTFTQKGVIAQTSFTTGEAACKKWGINWDSCVFWEQLPLVTESGQLLGLVGSIAFNGVTGDICSISIDIGVASQALLGTQVVSADAIKGFRRKSELTLTSEETKFLSEKTSFCGAIMASDEVANLEACGGAAEKAGKAVAVAANKAQSVVKKTKPIVDTATKKTGNAVNKGAYAVGRQLSKSKTMFAAFKEEYDKARHED